MVIGIIGENCTGKTTLAKEISKVINAEILSGKDYLRISKTESEAIIKFKKKLIDCVTGEHLIYIISELEQINLLPESSIKILTYADIITIKERFKRRLLGSLPSPVSNMLEKKHGCFNDIKFDYRYDSVDGDPCTLALKLKEVIR